MTATLAELKASVIDMKKTLRKVQAVCYNDGDNAGDLVRDARTYAGLRDGNVIRQAVRRSYQSMGEQIAAVLGQLAKVEQEIKYATDAAAERTRQAAKFRV